MGIAFNSLPPTPLRGTHGEGSPSTNSSQANSSTGSNTHCYNVPACGDSGPSLYTIWTNALKAASPSAWLGWEGSRPLLYCLAGVLEEGCAAVRAVGLGTLFDPHQGVGFNRIRLRQSTLHDPTRRFEPLAPCPVFGADPSGRDSNASGCAVRRSASARQRLRLRD